MNAMTEYYTFQNKDFYHYISEDHSKQSRLLLIQELISKLFGEYDTLIDLGCGSGIVGRMNSSFNTWIGIDIADATTQENRKYYKELYLSDLDKPFVDDWNHTGTKFKGVICTEVLEHLWNPEVCYKTISDLLETNGLAIITTPNADWFYRKLHYGTDLVYTPSIYKKPWIKEHIRHFTINSHQQFLQMNNMMISEIYGANSEFCPYTSNIVNTIGSRFGFSDEQLQEAHLALCQSNPIMQHTIVIIAKKI